jgi:PilZ domain
MANTAEAIPLAARVVDLSLGGALLSFAEPLGLLVDERVVVSIPADEAILLLGRVVRVARGTDFRTYVAVQFDDGQPLELERLDDLVESLFEAQRTPHPVSR